MPSRITILDESLDHCVGDAVRPTPEITNTLNRGRRDTDGSNLAKNQISRKEQRVRFACSHGVAVRNNNTSSDLLRRRDTSQLQAGLSPIERKEFFNDKDITSSKGLAGYGMNCVASAVVLTTAIMYRYTNNIVAQTLLEAHIIMLGRLRAVIALSSVGFAVSGFVVMCHFDTFLFPRVWASFFKNGSKKERALLITLLVYWIITLGISTGVYSAGQYQANVFFGCWASFASIFYAYDKWREGANKTACLKWVRDGAYETKMSLVGVAVFSTIVLLGAVDYTANLYIHMGESYNHFLEKASSTTLILWMFTCPAVSLIASVTILLLREERYHVFGGQSRNDNTPPGWYNTLEGVIHLGLFSIWTIVAFSSVQGVSAINAVDNMYFGSWGTFLFAMNGFGSWFKDYTFLEHGLPLTRKCCKCCKTESEDRAEL